MEFNGNPNQPVSEASVALSVDLFELVPVPLILIDETGLIVKSNVAESNLLGYSALEMQGRHIWEFVLEEEQDLSLGRFRAFLEGLALMPCHRRRFKTKANDCLICELSAQIVQDDATGRIYVLLASVNVTGQVTEARIRGEFAQWMEASFRSSAEAMMILDTLGRIRYLNREAEHLLGWTEAESAGALPEVLIPWSNIHASDGMPSEYSYEEGVAKAWSGTATVTTKSGTQKPLRIRTAPVIAANGIVLGISSCMSLLH